MFAGEREGLGMRLGRIPRCFEFKSNNLKCTTELHVTELLGINREKRKLQCT